MIPKNVSRSGIIERIQEAINLAHLRILEVDSMVAVASDIDFLNEIKEKNNLIILEEAEKAEADIMTALQEAEEAVNEAENAEEEGEVEEEKKDD